MQIDKTTVQTCVRQLEAFTVADPYMSLPQVLTFVRLVQLLTDQDDRWVRQADISEGVPVTSPSVSRALSYWSKFGDKKHTFVELTQDPQDRRHMLVGLTAKGNSFARTVFPQPRE
jgi:DNA-binding MarR family transcriptional regulator